MGLFAPGSVEIARACGIDVIVHRRQKWLRAVQGEIAGDLDRRLSRAALAPLGDQTGCHAVVQHPAGTAVQGASAQGDMDVTVAKAYRPSRLRQDRSHMAAGAHYRPARLQCEVKLPKINCSHYWDVRSVLTQFK